MDRAEYTYIVLPEDFGRAIRTARKERDMSQVQLANASGCSQRFVSQLERGKATAELGKALQVAAAVGLHLRIDDSQSPEGKRARVEQGIAHIAKSLQPTQQTRPKLADFLGQAR